MSTKEFHNLPNVDKIKCPLSNAHTSAQCAELCADSKHTTPQLPVGLHQVSNNGILTDLDGLEVQIKWLMNDDLLQR